MGLNTNFKSYWIVLKPQIMLEMRRMFGLFLILWISSWMLSQITRSVLIQNTPYPPPLLMYSMQAAKQKVIYDLGLELIVSH